MSEGMRKIVDDLLCRQLDSMLYILVGGSEAKQVTYEMTPEQLSSFEHNARVLVAHLMRRLWHGPLEPEVVHRIFEDATNQRVAECEVLCALAEAAEMACNDSRRKE